MDDEQNSTDFPRKSLSLLHDFLITDLCVDAPYWIGLNDISNEGNFVWVATSMVSDSY